MNFKVSDAIIATKTLIKLMSAIEFLSFIYPDIVESQLLITSILKKRDNNLEKGQQAKTTLRQYVSR